MTPHLANLSLHILLLMVMAEASARYFVWYARLRVSTTHIILRYGILGTSGIGAAMTAWVALLIYFGVGHRALPPFIGIGISTALLASFLAVLLPIWILDLSLSATYVVFGLALRCVIAIFAGSLLTPFGF